MGLYQEPSDGLLVYMLANTPPTLRPLFGSKKAQLSRIVKSSISNLKVSNFESCISNNIFYSF